MPAELRLFILWDSTKMKPLLYMSTINIHMWLEMLLLNCCRPWKAVVGPGWFVMWLISTAHNWLCADLQPLLPCLGQLTHWSSPVTPRQPKPTNDYKSRNQSLFLHIPTRFFMSCFVKHPALVSRKQMAAAAILCWRWIKEKEFLNVWWLRQSKCGLFFNTTCLLHRLALPIRTLRKGGYPCP